MARLRVREIAEAKGVGIAKLSRQADLSIVTIRRIWRNPHHDIALSTLEKIAAALGVSVTALIDDEHSAPPDPS